MNLGKKDNKKKNQKKKQSGNESNYIQLLGLLLPALFVLIVNNSPVLSKSKAAEPGQEIASTKKENIFSKKLKKGQKKQSVSYKKQEESQINKSSAAVEPLFLAYEDGEDEDGEDEDGDN